ncbi:TetR family transcriptional regulator [Actinospica sp. MGRD01-02]|uniref:TetR family transcriptional regulator n=1 Tax=Actinospica acidithermotolerans TaxID=2828514 RepID=A0A941EHP5_9ACTN|nr:TetR/AcrR family transcriptional regulator [Actinospica acidithermotolerans]MBR7827839.1 TetR family transcriptional regulator [Actinospica acidithermotolerans]
MDVPDWNPRRVAAVEAALPEGATPPGTRGRILHAGLALFAETGFAGTSIRAIAERVGINSATLYSHYPSKEQVLADLVLLGHRELADRLTSAAAALPGDAAADARLTALVRAHVRVHTDFPLLATVTNTELHALAPALAAPALELRAECRRMLIDILEHGVKDGVFAVPDLLLTATAIGAIGMHVASWFGPDQPFTGEQVADTYAALALRMAGIPEPA